MINDPKWLKASLKRFGYSSVSVHKADATTFNYQALGKIAFALIDLDLYRPVKESLKRILPQMVEGGKVVVDDCNDSRDGRWDGVSSLYGDLPREEHTSGNRMSETGIIRTDLHPSCWVLNAMAWTAALLVKIEATHAK